MKLYNIGLNLLFLTIASLWSIMMYYTVIPWVFNFPLPMDSDLDLSAVMWVFVSISIIGSGFWFFIQLTYLVVGKKIVKNQKTLIKNYDYSSNSPMVSILIPARNEEKVIKRTIEGCLSQTYRNIEILVICHNCTDGTFDVAQSKDKRVRPLEYRTSEAGKGIALNFGVKKAEGTYVLVLDADGILSPDFINNAIPYFKKGFAGIQGKIVSANRDYNRLTKMLSLEGYMFSTPFMAVRHFLDKRTPLAGTGFMLSKKILEKIGGFSNALIEDFELSFRIFKNNNRIAYSPLSVVHDEKPADLPSMYRQRARWVKGHIDMLTQMKPESKDIMGIIYWLSPVFLMSGLISILITSFSLITFILLGFFPYEFSFVPIILWFFLLIGSYTLQFLIAIKDIGIHSIKYALNLAIVLPFSQYWYICLIKSFFVKSWANNKTVHGFIRAQDIEKIRNEQMIGLLKFN
jgi:cellulose synthase/poly-beta-1,6-N-acetylglucosamine synthase-like glycosyltransferase